MPAKKPAPKKPAAKKPAAKNPAPKKPAPKKPAPKKPPPRADFGQPIDAFFARQPPALRPIVDALHALVRDAAPDAVGSLKWGMPWFAIGDVGLCAIGAHKAHVNLILPGPEGTYPDPDGLLVGTGKTGKHLALKTLAELPRATVAAWLAIATARARAA